MKNRRQFAVIGGVYAVLGALLANRISPQVAWEDAGELTTASFFLAPAHPPGFPLYLIVVRCFQLIPLSTVVFRSALFSLFAGLLSLAVGLRLLQTLEVDTKWLFPLGAAIILTPQFLLQSTVAEIYTFQTLLLTFFVFLVAKWRVAVERSIEGIAASYYLLWFTSGLCVSLQPVSILYLLPILVMVTGYSLRVTWTISETWRCVGMGLFFLMLGCSPMLFLLLRGQPSHLVHWGPLTTWQQVISHLSATAYREGFQALHSPINGTILWERCRQMYNVLDDSFIPLFWPLIILGLSSPKIHGSLRFSLGTLVMVDAAYALLINPMGMESLQTFLPLIVSSAILMVCGGDFLMEVLLNIRK